MFSSVTCTRVKAGDTEAGRLRMPAQLLPSAVRRGHRRLSAALLFNYAAWKCAAAQ